MDPSPHRSGGQLPLPTLSPTRSSTRPNSTRQPSLLPAFEPFSPFSSSPPQQSSKRKFKSLDDQDKHYPTPIPTSSTGILPSSPPRRQALQRTLSSLSERAPLGDLPTVVVPANGDRLRFGRSSNSSQYQLPYNRHISRVHVTAQYKPRAESDASGKIIVKCEGWNGAKLRCAGKCYELKKDDSWVSSHPAAEIMLDVMDCRVLIKWPIVEQGHNRRISVPELWGGESPRRVFPGLGNEVLPSSPPPMISRSPISPSPARGGLQHNLGDILTSDTVIDHNDASVQIYEDPSSDHIHEEFQSPSKAPAAKEVLQEKVSMSSLSSSNAEGLSDQENENEENDPIVHSFGPFGSNLLNRLNSFSHNSPQQVSPQRYRRPLKAPSASPQRDSSPASRKNSVELLTKIQESPVKNHVINQLAFSRVHAMPLSTIHSNLPAELQACVGPNNEEATLTQDDLERVLHSTPCVGEISREGKDAAGKQLENEFYYLPELDENQMRRDAVLGGRGGTGLRSVRKSHKQYYWKKPRH